MSLLLQFKSLMYQIQFWLNYIF